MERMEQRENNNITVHPILQADGIRTRMMSTVIRGIKRTASTSKENKQTI